MAPPSKYSPEFREEAVQIALQSSKTISETARDLELNPETLRGWVKQHQKHNDLPVRYAGGGAARAQAVDDPGNVQPARKLSSDRHSAQSLLQHGTDHAFHTGGAVS